MSQHHNIFNAMRPAVRCFLFVGILLACTSVAEGGQVSFHDENVVMAIDMLGRRLSEAMQNLGNAVCSSQNSDGITLYKGIFAVFVTIVGALSAYFFNYFHWKMVDRKNSLTKKGDLLTKIITDFEKNAIEYWLIDYSVQDSWQLSILEVSIKARLRHISKVISILKKEVEDKHNNNSLVRSLENFNKQVFDLATGDDFESKKRKLSKPKAMRIAFMCSDARAVISELG